MTPNEENKRKLLISQYLMLEKERNRVIDEIDSKVQELGKLGIKINLGK